MDQDKVLYALVVLADALSHTLELVRSGEPYYGDMADAALRDVARTIQELAGDYDEHGRPIVRTVVVE